MSNVKYTLDLPNLEKVGDISAKILLTRSVRCRAGLQEEKGGMRRRLGEKEMAYLRYSRSGVPTYALGRRSSTFLLSLIRLLNLLTGNSVGKI